MEKEKYQYNNELINESSPYLLQHAHNPVNWQAWNDKSLRQAKEESKLMIISVGYSACHWCHVMEHESFEDEGVAEVMNSDFINIKVDREERPDVDQVYMNAVQIMTGSGGWPMNIVALPDSRPVWGGTYFRKEQWKSALSQLSKYFREKPEEMEEYAKKLQEGLEQVQLVKLPEKEEKFSEEFITEVLEKWKKQFDHKNGGSRGAPKFMMPNNLQFLMRYAHQTGDKDLENHIQTSLQKISFGGVYDHVGGGFSRYSVDDHWHVPHFEKMLYDNAQLVSLYSKAHSLTGKEWYKEVVHESLKFIREEFTAENGAFYSAWDADSKNAEGKPEEGAYFIWKKEELQQLLGQDYELFADYYNINPYGKWEGENYVLIRSKEDVEIAEAAGISPKELQKKKKEWRDILQNERQKRSKPALDDKILTSWNALMLTGLVDAYKVFQKKEYLELALKNADFLKKNQLKPDFGLYHSYKNGKSNINGYLEDYAFCIEGFLGLYEVTFQEEWLDLARNLAEKSYQEFHNSENEMFFFTASSDAALITRPLEVTDNVVPASNSVMAKNLFRLGKYFDEDKYSRTAEAMLKNIQPQMISYPSGYSNWLDLMLNFIQPYYEVAVTGTNALQKAQEINRYYLPNVLLAGSTNDNNLPLTKHRFKEGQDLIYVCIEGKCELPSASVEDSLHLLKH